MIVLPFPPEMGIVFLPVDSGTIINHGDFVWWDTDDLKPAADFEWDTDLTTTQNAFAQKFAGIVQESSMSGETRRVPVATSPNYVHRVKAAANSYDISKALGPDENSSKLHNQQLESAANNLSCFTCVEIATIRAGELLAVRLHSAYWGHNTAKALG